MRKNVISLLTSIMFIFTFVVNMNTVITYSYAMNMLTNENTKIIYRGSGDSKDCSVKMSYFILVYDNGHIHIEVQCTENKATKPGLMGNIAFTFDDIAVFNESGKSGDSIFTGHDYYSRYNTKYINDTVQYDLLYSDYVDNDGGLTLMNIDLYIKENPINKIIPIYVFEDYYEIDSSRMNWIVSVVTTTTITTTTTTTTTSTSTSTTTTTTTDTLIDTNTTTGKCGKFASYILDENGNLVIVGTGKLYDYCEDITYSDEIKNVIISDGITYFGNIFYKCKYLKTITIPETVIAIDEDAFEDCPCLSTIIGFTPSYAQQYAMINKINFITIGNSSTYILGDANSDTIVNMADAVLIMQTISNPDKYKLDTIGMLVADVNYDGCVSNLDALFIQKYKLGITERL